MIRPIRLFMTAGILCLASASYSAVIFSDTFTGQNLTRPLHWQVIGAPVEGYWFIQDGQFATCNGEDLAVLTGYSYAVIRGSGSESWTDYTIQTDMWMAQENGRITLVGRWRDENNHYEANIEIDSGRRAITIVKVLGGRRWVLDRFDDGEDGRTIPVLEK